MHLATGIHVLAEVMNFYGSQSIACGLDCCQSGGEGLGASYIMAIDMTRSLFRQHFGVEVNIKIATSPCEGGCRVLCGGCVPGRVQVYIKVSITRSYITRVGTSPVLALPH